MKIYKIGRYYYKEISEKVYCEIQDNLKSNEMGNLFCLSDRDADPIKFFIRVKHKFAKEVEDE